MLLGAVGEPVEEEVDGEEEQSPRDVGAVLGIAAAVLLLLARVQGENGDAGGHRSDDEVLVQRVSLAEDGDVKKHDGQELAALGEEEGDVVNMRERGVAEGAGEGVCDRNEG